MSGLRLFELGVGAGQLLLRLAERLLRFPSGASLRLQTIFDGDGGIEQDAELFRRIVRRCMACPVRIESDSEGRP